MDTAVHSNESSLLLQVDHQRSEEPGPPVGGQQPGPGDQHVGGPGPVQAGLQGGRGGGQHRRQHSGDGL